MLGAWGKSWGATNTGSGTGQEVDTFKAKHSEVFTILARKFNFIINKTNLYFSIKPIHRSFRITTYVNGEPV